MENAHEALQKFGDKSVRCLRVNWVEVGPGVCEKCTKMYLPTHAILPVPSPG